jgi:hypothetical protein
MQGFNGVVDKILVHCSLPSPFLQSVSTSIGLKHLHPSGAIPPSARMKNHHEEDWGTGWAEMMAREGGRMEGLGSRLAVFHCPIRSTEKLGDPEQPGWFARGLYRVYET